MKYKNKLSITFLATLALAYFASPFILALGAASMNSFSVFEFFLIDLMTVPIDNKQPEKISEGYAFLLPELFDGALRGFRKHVYEQAEISFKPELSNIITFLPLITVLLLSPLNLLLLPFKLISFFIVLPIVILSSIAIAALTDMQVYRYIRIMPLLHSITFAVLTDFAASFLLSGSIVPAVLLYSISIIPLYKFAERAQSCTLVESDSLLSKLSFLMGCSSILFHITEAVANILSAVFHIPALKVAGKLMTSNEVQGPIIAATTFMAALVTTESLTTVQSR